MGDLGDYRCQAMPQHMSKEVFIMQTMKNRIYYQFLTGGILSLRPQHFKVANGFSNIFYGWGGEDDNFTMRMFSNGLCIIRQTSRTTSQAQMGDEALAPFTMLRHIPSTPPKMKEQRFWTLKRSIENFDNDGLNNIDDVSQIVKMQYFKAFTHLLVKVKAEEL
jgi:beta-1,4-galactosyltransferase 1